MKKPLKQMRQPKQQKRTLVSLRQRPCHAQSGIQFLSRRWEIPRIHPGISEIPPRTRRQFRRTVFRRKRCGFRKRRRRTRFIASAGKQNPEIILHLRNQPPRLQLSRSRQRRAEQRLRIRSLTRKHHRRTLRSLRFRNPQLCAGGLRLLFQFIQRLHHNLVLPEFPQRLHPR